MQNLLDHCEHQIRIAIVDRLPTPRSRRSAIRAQFHSKYGAVYYPWVTILDLRPRTIPPRRRDTDAAAVGFTAGIYAGTDMHAACTRRRPTNVYGMTKRAFNVTYDRQSVLNPEGINASRFFEARSNRVWGARTMNSIPESKYVNVRRLSIYLQHSIDRSTQWAVSAEQ